MNMRKSLLSILICIFSALMLTSCDPWYYVDIADTDVCLHKKSYSTGETIEIVFTGKLKKKECIDGLDFYFLINRFNEENEPEPIDVSEIIICDNNSLEYEKGPHLPHPYYNLRLEYREENIIIHFYQNFMIQIETPGKYELRAEIEAVSMKMNRIPQGSNSFVIPFEIK